ncbi:methylated-DNA--[protein]-cysteine S-methyltransferase [Mucilaginibacter gotjawali]|uniref:Methylated-DNA-[protein]-cysteine S-methyltransferase n=2 Tax=Mucilaginibacter gotjawali TaxID=1550579 RepID=A0A839SCW4_9SPHI|nr:methylated-DNA--[protein]-cysteine S-methyltransferase [Mucilaginibacter gotjawali]MBB3056055.1 methylated-DNA-[protein]-cysteine S-methyltransferase [Mucilaginibacter gotjawali]BAU53608.1 Methylated-DNA--protein-cysteine methyltransferase, constitutive [Mucilaginibacter gotjawali]
MPSTYHKTPIGFARITEEEGFITSIYLLDGEFEETAAETPLLKTTVQQLDEYFEGKRTTFALPLKQKGTDFQQQVWEQLTKIAYGKTISYAQQSKFMNNPLGIRAIASANGKNHLVIVVPCHRVIGSDGSLTGFGCGVWRKKWLLEHEARVTGSGQTVLNL